jgi:heme/copper-type cytochrome/quinol oxidase subunit 3
MAPTRRVTTGGSVLHLADTADVRPGLPPLISNARLAMAGFLAFETMFFVALIGAYLVFRLSHPVWPPPDLPRLPIAVTWANTGVLLVSAFLMARALRALRMGQRPALERALFGAALLGTTFLAVQGTEWIRLVRHGLTISAGPYGATFYTLIGCHGLHVLAAVLWLLVVMIRAQRHRFAGPIRVPLELCGIYWFFVVALWAALFPLVYLL